MGVWFQRAPHARLINSLEIIAILDWTECANHKPRSVAPGPR